MKILVLILAVLGTVNAQAVEQRLAIYGGLTQSGNAHYDAPASGLAYRSGDVSAKSSVAYGAEYTYQTDAFWGGSVFLDSVGLKNSDGTTDQFTSLMVAPRAEMTFNPGMRVNAWGAFGVGPQLNVYNVHAVNSGTTLVVNKSPNNLSLVLSPRIGAEVYLMQNAFVGIQAAYTMSSQTLNVENTPSGGVTTSSTQAVSRHWLTTSLRVGFNF